ncbi:MAG TPA: hypothetical protein K8W19_07525 [Victivallis vadensis]|uniref:hypothetical protein n=1 Tax=uncultured Victivallis sp. TaxID=354118 RepID=UPI001DE197FA|nr:hypothetical protein [uncultured Victivallis sp.]HJH03861.1 hypothetical protein [Victivallis vadensis]
MAKKTVLQETGAGSMSSLGLGVVTLRRKYLYCQINQSDREKTAKLQNSASLFGGRKGDGGGNALTAGNKNSRCLFLIPASAFARVVSLRLRSAFADLAFRLLLSCACAARQQPTSVPPLDRVRQAAGGVSRLWRIYFRFLFLGELDRVRQAAGGVSRLWRIYFCFLFFHF